MLLKPMLNLAKLNLNHEIILYSLIPYASFLNEKNTSVPSCNTNCVYTHADVEKFSA